MLTKNQYHGLVDRTNKNYEKRKLESVKTMGLTIVDDWIRTYEIVLKVSKGRNKSADDFHEKMLEALKKRLEELNNELPVWIRDNETYKVCGEDSCESVVSYQGEKHHLRDCEPSHNLHIRKIFQKGD